MRRHRNKLFLMVIVLVLIGVGVSILLSRVSKKQTTKPPVITLPYDESKTPKTLEDFNKGKPSNEPVKQVEDVVTTG